MQGILIWPWNQQRNSENFQSQSQERPCPGLFPFPGLCPLAFQQLETQSKFGFVEKWADVPHGNLNGEMMIIKPLECGECLLFRHICLPWCQCDKCLQVALAIKRDKTKENNRCKISSNIQKLYFASLSKQSNLVIHGFQKTT